MLNDVNLIGRLGKNPELRTTPNGNMVTDFNIACTSFKETEWIRIEAWGKTAENVCAFCTKGSLVYVSGRLKTDTYEKDGVKKFITKVVGNRVVFLDPKAKNTDIENQPTEQKVNVMNSITSSQIEIDTSMQGNDIGF